MYPVAEARQVVLPVRRRHGRESARRQVVGLVFLTYGLLIFEGALRKWVFPQFELILFFIRVPVVVGIYLIALQYRMWPRPYPPLSVAYLFALVAIPWVFLQMVLGDYFSLPGLLLAGYGWHNYFFYIPLAFIIGEQFQRDDLARLMRWTFWLALPAAALVYLQFTSPAIAIVNQGAALDEAHQFQSFTAALGYIRPSGFFTSSGGQGQFVATLTAMLLACWLLPASKRWTSRNRLFATTAAVGAMIALSGSRGQVLMTGLLALFAVLAGFLASRGRVAVRAFVWPALLGLVFVILWPMVLPDSYETFMVRWDTAAAFESQVYSYGIFERALTDMYKFTDYLGEVPFLGFLLGMGGNAANRIAWLPHSPIPAEEGLSRHIIELGPVLGLAFIVFRAALVVWLGSRVVKATHRLGEPLPAMLFVYVALLLGTQQITGAGVLQGYAWLFFGFCLAAARAKGAVR